MKRIAIAADESAISALKRIARNEKKSFAEVVREALDALVASRRSDRKVPSFVGIGRSDRSDVAQRHEALLFHREKAQAKAGR